MARFDKDNTAKWLLSHYGDSYLRHFAVVERIDRWIAAANEITVPKQVPDGLLQVWSDPQQKEADPYLIEVATYPAAAISQQILTDLAACFSYNEKVPETTVIILHVKGQVDVLPFHHVRSPSKRTGLSGDWSVRCMWQEPADDALRTEDPAMAVFAPLMQYAERPEILFQKCRNIIDAKAKDIHWLNLLAATQVLAKPRYNDPALFEILGGQTIMIESPLLDEVRAQGELRAYRNSVLILSAAGSGTFKK